MLKLFKPKNHSMLGIDISTAFVKIVELSTEADSHTILGFDSEALPEGAVEAHVIKNVDMIADVIKSLVYKAGFKTKLATVAVPDSAVISKVIQINEGLNESEIEEFIMLEADKYIPFPIEEINLDFQLLGPSIKNPAKVDVLIVASRSGNVDSRVEAVRKAGLEPIIIDVESFAIERMVNLFRDELPFAGQEKNIAVMDVGSSYANLCVLHDMKMIYTREEEFGGKQLIKDIIHRYGLTALEVEEMQHKNQFPSDFKEAVLMPFVELLVLQLKRALQFFYSTSHHEHIDHILLAGGVANIPNLATWVQEELKIPTTVADPLHVISVARNTHQGTGTSAPSFMIACGLALRQAGRYYD